MFKRTKLDILAKIRQLPKFKAPLHKHLLSNSNKIYRIPSFIYLLYNVQILT